MPFLGKLTRATAYTINVDGGTLAVGETAITILKMNSRQNLASVETESVAGGTRVSFSGEVGARIDRLIVQVHPPRNATVNVEVVQGSNSFPQACDGDTDMVFDAIT
jgi:hypothetical protein